MSSANTAWTEMPISRRGMDNSHTIGASTSAITATGQHNTNKMHHPTNKIIAFISSNVYSTDRSVVQQS